MSRYHVAIKNSREWKEARAACLDRDGHQCVRCGSSEELHADHIVRLSDQGDPFSLDNLQTLCRECHADKEREYSESKKVRANWVNPDYSELDALIKNRDETLDNESEAVLVL